MTKLQALAAKLKAAELKANRLYDTAFEIADAMPGTEENARAEAAWEKAEDAAIALRETLAAEIVKMTFGQIDEPTAYKMTYSPKLYDLIARMT